MGNCVQTKNSIESLDTAAVYNNSWFMLATQAGDLVKVKKYISMGVDINYQDPKNKNTALMISSNSGDHIMVGVLLDNGACPTVINKHGYTALSFAARNGHLEICRLLLFKFNNWEAHIGNIINGKSIMSYETPLMQAVYWGHRDVVIMLLENGADINARTKYGWTPLDFAKAKNNLEIVFLLTDPQFLDFKTPRRVNNDDDLTSTSVNSTTENIYY